MVKSPLCCPCQRYETLQIPLTFYNVHLLSPRVDGTFVSLMKVSQAVKGEFSAEKQTAVGGSKKLPNSGDSPKCAIFPSPALSSKEGILSYTAVSCFEYVHWRQERLCDLLIDSGVVLL